ncbi:MAG: class I SAM-dependent methyltransferase [Syntrophales bacterium]
MKEQEKYWGKFSATYDEYTEYVVGRDLRNAILEKLRTEGYLGDTLETGCGTGFFTGVIASKAKHLTATDISAEMLAAAEKNAGSHGDVIFRTADCQDLPFGTGEFDTVFMANVLHAVESPEKALNETRRVLKSGGLLLVICYTDYGMNWFEKMILGIKFLEKFGLPPPYGLRNYSPLEFEHLISNAGFRMEEILLIGNRPAALYARARSN